MQTFVGYKPCIEQYSIESDPNAVFYPLENEQKWICAIDKTTQKVYDTRYKPIGLEMSEYDVQVESGVLTTLNNLPLYQQYVP